MIALIEKEIQQNDHKLKELLSELSLDTTPKGGIEVDYVKVENMVLRKLLKEQKLKRRNKLFALENGLLIFAIAMFGVLSAFVGYLLMGYNLATPTWEELGRDLSVLILLFSMTAMSAILYFQHYRHKIPQK